MEKRPSAFVIMPFDSEFTEVYESFLAPILKEVGYEVLRADDLYGQRNILRDIVRLIAESNIVVADLTALNPNVFYELGLAHALQKPVVMLTQSIEELPFDLRGYRVISYDTHFARIERARESLRQTAMGAIKGSIEFGNPVSDFAALAASKVSRQFSPSGTPSGGEDGKEEEEELGWLDYRAALETGLRKQTEILNNIAKHTNKLTTHTDLHKERLARINSHEGGAASISQAVTNEYGRKLAQYGESLAAANGDYENAARSVDDSIEQVLSSISLDSKEDFRALSSFVESLENIEPAASGAAVRFIAMRSSVRSLEGVEKVTTRAAKIVGRELDRFVGNVEKTIASMQRGIEVGRQKLLLGETALDVEATAEAEKLAQG